MPPAAARRARPVQRSGCQGLPGDRRGPPGARQRLKRTEKGTGRGCTPGFCLVCAARRAGARREAGPPLSGRPQVAPTSSAQAVDHSLPRKRESSFPPLGLLLPTPTTSLGRRGGPIGRAESYPRAPSLAPLGQFTLSRPTGPAVAGANGRMISAPTGTTVTAPGRAGHSAELHAVLHAHGLDAGQGRPKAARRFGNPNSFSRWGN